MSEWKKFEVDPMDVRGYGLRFKYREGITGDVLISYDGAGDKSIPVYGAERIPLARVLCEGMGYTVVAEDAAKQLTPEQIKAECEAEAERRGLDVEFWTHTMDSYMVSVKGQLYPAVFYSHDRNNVPRVIFSYKNDTYYPTIQDAISAFMDEVEKIVKPKSCKDVMLADARIEIDKAKAAIAAAEHNISESISCDQ